LVPGPRLFTEHPEVAYPFMFGMLITVLLMVLVGWMGASTFVKVMHVPLKVLVPVILVLFFLGAYSINNGVFDIFLVIIFGLLGILFKRIAIPIAPIVLGIILGPIGEEGLRQSIIIADVHGQSLLSYVSGRPISIVLFVVLITLLGTSFSAYMKLKKTL
jgi:putative tricarboxylic transport membrane protein